MQIHLKPLYIPRRRDPLCAVFPFALMGIIFGLILLIEYLFPAGPGL